MKSIFLNQIYSTLAGRSHKRLRTARKSRLLLVEHLLARLPLTAEGQSFSFNQIYETAGLGGSLSGSVLWGDGTSSPAVVATSPATGSLLIRLDYSLDTSGFFADQQRRDVLQQVANSIISKFSDQLTAITPSGSNQWTATFVNPSTGAQDTRNNLTIPANEIVIYVGARGLSGTEFGRGEVGGFTASGISQAFIDNVSSRGQSGALAATPTDYGPWGGTIAFSSATKWHFGATTDGLDPDEVDFASVAAHEVMHVIGFGLSDSWFSKVSGGFRGANSIAVSGQNPVPLNDASHWKSGTIVDGRTVIMTPGLAVGIRKLATRLDYAGLQDLGWQLLTPQVQASASHTFGDDGTYPAALVLNGSIFGSLSYPLSVSVTNVSPVLTALANQSATQSQPLTIAKIGQFTDPGFGAPLATPPRAETFTYNINWGDGTAPSTGSATIESLGSTGQDTKGFFDGSHTYAQMGNFTVTMVVSDDDGGTSQQQFNVLVGPPPTLELAIDRNSFSEDAGANAATLTVRRVGFDTATATTVTLVSSDLTEIQLPPSVTIPAGQTSATVAVQAIDDTLLDGTIKGLLSATVGSIASNQVEVDVLDHENILLSLSTSFIAENGGAGAASLTVSRSNTDIGQSISVQLSSNDTTEADLPARVTIPAGSSSVIVGVNAIDDALFDGPQIVTLSASSTGYESASVQVTVTDFQPLSLVLQANELVEEDPSKRTTQADLSIRSPAPAGGLTLQLVASQPSQLIVPASVFIPAGAQTVQFPVSAVDDFAPQGRRNVRITASGNGVTPTSIDIVISDDDPAYWTNPVNPLDVNNDTRVDPLDVLVIINEINFRGPRTLNPNTDRGLQFVDPNKDGRMDPLDVLAIINALNLA